MFWKRTKTDPDSEWKKQHDTIATNPIYSFINIHGKGTLVDVYNKTFETEGTKALEDKIKEEIEPYLYNKGLGKVITEADFRDWKLSKMQQRNPNLTAVDINLFDDDFNKFAEHEVCWDLNKRGGVGETPLHLCLLGDTDMHITIAHILLKLYPKLALDFYEADEYYGESCLHIAIVNENFEMVKLLVQCGTDVNQRASGRFFLPEDQKVGKAKATNYEGYAYYGEYPLAFAASFGREEMYDYLIDHGADPNVQDSFGNTVLHLMVIANQNGMLGYAVKHHAKRANMEIMNNEKLTPLTLASKLGRNEIFKEIIELQSIEIWRYSNITCSTYPLGPLDTIGKDGKTNWGAALIYITEGESEEHLEMLEGGVIKQLLHNKWKGYVRRRFLERLVLAALHLLLLSVAIYTRPEDDLLSDEWDVLDIVRYISEVIICLACFITLVFQLEEVRSQGFIGFMKNQASAPAKMIFNFSCILILLCIPMRFLGLQGPEMILLAIAAPCAWAFLLFFARASPLFGPFVIIIYKMAASDVVRFVIIFLVFLAQFSLGFLFLFKDLDNENIQSFKDIGSTVMQLFQMTLGEFKMSKGDSSVKYEDFGQTRNPYLTKAVFMVFAILVPILLLNMLIAMMGNTYQQIINRSEKEWKRQWAKIIIVLERTFSPRTLKMYQDIYSNEFPNSNGARGLIVIKTSRKTKARQRKGAIGNWKKLVSEIKVLIKERKRQGKKGPLDLSAEDISEKVLEHQLRKRRSTLRPTISFNGDEDDVIGDDSGASGLLAAMNQLAWERDIDLSKGKSLTDPASAIREESEHEGGATRTSSPGDRTPLLKDAPQPAFQGQKRGATGNSNNNSKHTANLGGNVKKDGGPAGGRPGGRDPKAGQQATPTTRRGGANKVHPEDEKGREGGNWKKPAGNSADTTIVESAEEAAAPGAGVGARTVRGGANGGGGRQGPPARRPSGLSGSGVSKDSAFYDVDRGRRTALAMTGSKSSLNSASSLTSLLHAWDGKETKAADPNVEF